MIGLVFMLLSAVPSEPHFFGVSAPDMVAATSNAAKRCGIELTARPWKEGDSRPEPTADMAGWQTFFSDKTLDTKGPQAACYIDEMNAVARDLLKKGRDMRVMPNSNGQVPLAR